MNPIYLIAFIASILLYVITREFNFLVTALGCLGFLWAMKVEEKDKYLFNKLLVKVQYETNVFSYPKLIKKIIHNAFKADHQFYDKTPYRVEKSQSYIDDKSLYDSLLESIIQMQSKRNKWYGRFYSKQHFKRLDLLLSAFHLDILK